MSATGQHEKSGGSQAMSDVHLPVELFSQMADIPSSMSALP